METITVKATYDGSSFKIHGPVDLEPNTEYILTVEKEDSKKPENALEVLRKNIGSISGPADWSEEHDHYIHGTPKRGINGKTASFS
jgi:hypothetical protein